MPCSFDDACLVPELVYDVEAWAEFEALGLFDPARADDKVCELLIDS